MIQQSLFAQIDDLPILPFPGNKRTYVDLFLGHEQYLAHIEPFLGGGALALASNSHHKYVADADPTLQIQWRLMIDGQWDFVLRGLRMYQLKVAQAMATQGYKEYEALTPGDRRDEAKEAGGEAIQFLQIMDAIWESLLDKLQGSDRLDKAIAALAIRKLGFYSVIRKGKKGRLNIKWTVSKFDRFVSFRGSQPLIKGEWKLYNDAFKALQAFRRLPPGPAMAMIDPPYWLPWVPGVRNQMTPAYPDHLPHNDSTFQLGVGVLRQAALSPFIQRIVYCNYLSEPMNTAVMAIAEAHHKVEAIELKPLDDDGERIDHAWILTRKGR